MTNQSDAIELVDQLDDKKRLLSQLFASRVESVRDAWIGATTVQDRERLHAEVLALAGVRDWIHSHARRFIKD